MKLVNYNFITVMRIKRYFTTVMRIGRYPFCARRCLSKKEKETGRELNGSLDRSLLFWFAFEPQWWVAWTWKFWIRSVHVICARLVDRSNYGSFSKSAPLRDTPQFNTTPGPPFLIKVIHNCEKWIIRGHHAFGC